jgi:hypothetical protein
MYHHSVSPGNSEFSDASTETNADSTIANDDPDMPRHVRANEGMKLLWFAFRGPEEHRDAALERLKVQTSSDVSAEGLSSKQNYACPVSGCSRVYGFPSWLSVITSVFTLPPEKPAEDLPHFRDMQKRRISSWGSTGASLKIVEKAL